MLVVDYKLFRKREQEILFSRFFIYIEIEYGRKTLNFLSAIDSLVKSLEPFKFLK